MLPGGKLGVFMQKYGEEPRLVGYPCEWCVADARGEEWRPEIGDKVHVCTAHADILKHPEDYGIEVLC